MWHHPKSVPFKPLTVRLIFVFRLLQVGWDESTAGERQPRVSLWEIEPLTTFPMYPSLFPLRLKRPWHPGVSSVHGICFLSAQFILALYIRCPNLHLFPKLTMLCNALRWKV